MNHGYTYTDKITTKDNGLTALDYYTQKYTHSTRATWYDRLSEGEILRASEPLSPETILHTGDILTWNRPPWEEGVVPKNYKIIYEDDAILAVDKPVGLPVSTDGGYIENTLVTLLNSKYPQQNIVPAHRLNRGTSGIVLFSKTKEARTSLAIQFRDKTLSRSTLLSKTYYAITKSYSGAAVGDTKKIETPIGEVPHPILGKVFAANPEGKPSASIVSIEEIKKGKILWKINLITGRTHQIRIHLASIGFPLLGDPFFLPGGHPRPDARPSQCGYILRSARISFMHPATNLPITLSVGKPTL